MESALLHGMMLPAPTTSRHFAKRVSISGQSAESELACTQAGARGERNVSFGTELRQERERRSVDLPSIAAATKVSERYLRALEADAFQDLPGGIFNKGMLRSYCRYLSLDEAAWSERFLSVCPQDIGEPDWSAFAENVRQSRPPRPATGMRWWGVALMMATVAALTWGAWHFLLHRRLGAAKPDIQTVGTAQNPLRS